MSNNNTNSGYNGGHIFMAALGGAVVGAGVALLTAPRSGIETREQINKMIDERREQAARLPDAIKDAGESAQKAFTKAIKS